MKKKVLLSLLLIVGLFTIVGCGKSKMSAAISVSVGGNTHISSVKEDTVLEFGLSEEKYEFKVIELTEKEMKIKVNKDGLTSEEDLLSKDNEFTLKKGVKVTLKDNNQNTIAFRY